MSLSKILHPNEYQIQAAIIEWSSYDPILSQYLLAIENERHVTPWKGKKRQLRGIKAGVSDLFLAYPCGGYHGLWIELKVDDKKKAKVSLKQAAWIQRMRGVGYAAYVTYGYDETVKIITEYLYGDIDD